jgi:putative CocE/NonD family hydrolase
MHYAPRFSRPPAHWIGAAALALCGVLPAAAQTPVTASDIPAVFNAPTAARDYDKRDVMIPMRDGVRLHTVILVPRGARRAPILLTRTPYNAAAAAGQAPSAHLAMVLRGGEAWDVAVEGVYIRAFQDVRGKYGSEGDYVMNRPLHGPLNPTPVDHSTDTYDTVDWLVKNVPETNGRVGIIGTSYGGFLSLMALVNPHPALKAAVPINPMVDGWRGDDWFHNGAFRQANLLYIFNQAGSRANTVTWWDTAYDDYDTFMQAVSAGELARRRGMEQIGFWQKILAHPAYDEFWQQQAMDKVLGARPLTIPVLLVHSLWDQEDIYGAIAVYKALEPNDSGRDKVFLVLGPWRHAHASRDASSLGPLRFGADTAAQFRRRILRPWLDQYLKDDAPRADVSPVTAFETGTNTWRRLEGWPAGCESGCRIVPTPLYLRAGLALGLDAPGPSDAAFDEYVSDPAKPVPYRSRPIRPMYAADSTWAEWLVDDQREASGRPDVLAFTSEPLTAPVKISGQPMVHLVASTSGTDSDWVVKLIDVYPPEYAPQPAMGGYQLAVAMDIFRGRYRESPETARPLAPDVPLAYAFALPTANHVFLPGHRIMVQVQSSWFPLYDRNPQTFVPDIFRAKAEDYRRAVQRVYHAPGRASFVELPLVK